MSTCKNIAHRLREVLLDGKWIANTNFKEQIVDVPWENAVFQMKGFNSIAMLTFHINYYVEGVLNVLNGGDLTIKDKYSFNVPTISSEADWKKLVNGFILNAEQLALAVEKLDNDLLERTFVDEKYGTYLRNLEAVIEHSYYHLGQLTLINKMGLTRSFQGN